MAEVIDVRDICCVALELSKSSWVCAFAPPGDEKVSIHNVAARDVEGLVKLLERLCRGAERRLSRPLSVTVCHEAGYDGFWIARSLIAREIPTIVFDPASFLRPRRGRVAKTDRLDAEGMCRTLRTWLAGDLSVATAVRIQSVEEEDAKRLGRERKYLIHQRTRVVSRIKGLLALHGIQIDAKGIGKRLAASLTSMRTAEGRELPKFVRRDIERMLKHHALIMEQIAEVDAERTTALKSEEEFPEAEKVKRLSRMAGVGEISATILVAEVFHREFQNRRHLASFIGLAPSPYASGETARDRGINKAGTKLARLTLVELAWFWLRYQPQSALALWWHKRFAKTGMRGRKVGIVALARKLAVALWRFVEFGIVPEGATLKA
jgi:transposase